MGKIAERISETEYDIENVEAWAIVIEHVLVNVPMRKRLAVLALASEKQRRIQGYVLRSFNVEEAAHITQHLNSVIRLKSLLVQFFVRSISNNHSPKDAAAILYGQHPYGHGSGELLDYLPEKGPFLRKGLNTNPNG